MRFASSSPSGALNEVSGIVATNATWAEDIYFTDADGSPLDLTGLTFKMTFRLCDGSTTAQITLSTSDYLSLVVDTDSGVRRILRITVPDGTLSINIGDYICDLASEDVSGVVTLWGHGVVTFRLNPVSF